MSIENTDTIITGTGGVFTTSAGNGATGTTGFISVTDYISMVSGIGTTGLNDYSGVDPVTPTRRRRPRTPKPSYYQMPRGETSILPVKHKHPSQTLYSEEYGKPLMMSPYTDFIPLPYLFHVPPTPNSLTTNFTKILGDRDRLEGLTLAERRKKVEEVLEKRSFWLNKILVLTQEGKRKEVYNGVEEYLLYDELIPLSAPFYQQALHPRVRGIEEVPDIFNMQDEYYSFIRVRGRRHETVFGGLSMLLTSPWGRSIQSIGVLATVRSEDYLYHKYHLLTTGCIDVSKLVILVDRDLDDTTYDCKPVRDLYKKIIAPELSKLNANIWKVPHRFIRDNCFAKLPILESATTKDLKEEKASILMQFYDDLTGKVDVEEIPSEQRATAIIEERMEPPVEVRTRPLTVEDMSIEEIMEEIDQSLAGTTVVAPPDILLTHMNIEVAPPQQPAAIIVEEALSPETEAFLNFPLYGDDEPLPI